MQPRARTDQRALRTSAPPHFASGSEGFEHIHVLNQGQHHGIEGDPYSSHARSKSAMKATPRTELPTCPSNLCAAALRIRFGGI